MFDASKPYRAKNMIVKKLETAPATGFLDVRVVSSEENEPISSAKVTLYLFEIRGLYRESAIENEIISNLTDESGKVPIMELPVIHEFGNPEENLDEYHMRVEATGYYPLVVMNIEIFPDVTTAFNVRLNHIVTGEPHTEIILIPEKH